MHMPLFRSRGEQIKTADRRHSADLPFALLTLLLLAIGVVMVLSASFASAYYDIQGETGHDPAYFFSRQAVFAAAGVGVMWLFSRIPMETYHKFSGAAMAAALACLAAVPVVGTVVNGARRWISLGFTTFQPSEITKIAIILYFSALICKYRDRMRTFRYGILPFAAVLLVVAVLLILEPHFSATIIIFLIGASMLFLGGARLGWFIGGGALLVVGGSAAVLLVPYVADRVASFLDPFSDLTGDGWQIVFDAALQRTRVIIQEADRAKLARKNAQAIVEQYADCSDYVKLAGYVMEICRLVRFDDEAATLEWQYANPQVQDPWKLIWVFDGEDSTNVVCEGYAQAYQYLCELTKFDGDIRCRLVTGYVDDTEHSWNLVRMDDKRNYLVDVSWMDGDWDGMDDELARWISENRGRLFLCGGSGSVCDGYGIFNRCGEEEEWRRYRDDTLALYPDAALALAPKPYTPTGFHRLPDGVRYFDQRGAFITGEALLDGYGYRFDDDGRLEGKLSGWHTVDGERRFFEDDGKLHAKHAPVVDTAVPPTCTDPGLTEGSHCAVCEAVLTPQEPVKMLGHNWGKGSYVWAKDLTHVTARHTCLNDPAHEESETVETTAQVTKAATCTARGVTTYTARFRRTAFKTQKKQVKNIPATGHAPVADPAVPPTATTDGLTAGSHCAICGKVFVRQRTIPRLDIALILRGNTCRLVDVGRPRQIFVELGPATSYKSDDPSIASVNRKGLVIPRAPGIVLITIRLKDDRVLLLKLVVRDSHAPKSVRITQGRRAVLKVGKKLKLKAVLQPAGAKSALRWTSSKPRIASVSTSGVVRARMPGRATIFVYTSNGKRAAISIIVVK